jgi:RIO kinase 1
MRGASPADKVRGSPAAGLRMKAPAPLLELIELGIIDAVLRPLKSGKEAAVYVVRRGDEICCAKVYKDMAQRSFQNRVQYQEGRKARGSRESRAMGKASKFGKREAEAAWKSAEVDALYRFFEAGVRVPKPYGFYGGVLVMELVTDASGGVSPRLGEVQLEPDVARDYHLRLIREVVRMLCCGLIHGDLSEYNVLVDAQGPVVIDFPQVVDAAGNNAARDLLRRDVNNLSISLGRFAPELMLTRYAEEMWALFQSGELTPESVLTGEFEEDQSEVDLDAIEWAIRDAREEALIREQGRQAAAEAD